VRARFTSLTASWKLSYSRVVPVTRLSRAKVTLSVPKNARSASASAELWKACAAGYAGWLAGVRSGTQVGSARGAGFPSVAANGIGRRGRQNEQWDVHSE